jgi:phosphatidylglycerophosphate synthase
MLDARIRPLIDPALERAADGLAATPVTANAVTLGGFAVGVAAVVAVAAGSHLAGLALLLLNRLLDGLDGALARRHGVTDLGGFLDIVLDFVFYSGFVLGFAVADPERNALAAAFLIFTFVGTGGSFLAFAVMAERRGLEGPERGRKSLHYLGGLTEGTETIAVFVLFCLLPGWFPQLALGFGLLCCVTTASRIAIAWQTLR